jgi:hypothetical protein
MEAQEKGEMRIRISALAMALLLAAAPNALALSNPGDIGRFHGIWVGYGVTAEMQPRESAVTARDIDVTIRETKTGFEMTWKSLGRDRAKRISARFVAAGEPGTFKVSLVDPPLSDEEKLWAQVEGDRLVVYLSSVGDDGAAHMARYQRSILDGRMTLKYTLSRGDELLESLTGSLSRAKVVL